MLLLATMHITHTISSIMQRQKARAMVFVISRALKSKGSHTLAIRYHCKKCSTIQLLSKYHTMPY